MIYNVVVEAGKSQGQKKALAMTTSSAWKAERLQWRLEGWIARTGKPYLVAILSREGQIRRTFTAAWAVNKS